LVVHVVRHASVVVLHTYGPHDEPVAAAHMPAPLHSLGGVNVEPVQSAATHCVPVT
jgi:hypothetical protein